MRACRKAKVRRPEPRRACNGQLRAGPGARQGPETHDDMAFLAVGGEMAGLAGAQASGRCEECVRSLG